MIMMLTSHKTEKYLDPWSLLVPFSDRTFCIPNLSQNLMSGAFFI